MPASSTGEAVPSSLSATVEGTTITVEREPGDTRATLEARLREKVARLSDGANEPTTRTFLDR